MFLWLAGRGRVMTNQFRLERDISSCGDCSCCPGILEDILHVLRDCHKAVEVWRRIVPPSFHTIFFSENSVKK